MGRQVIVVNSMDHKTTNSMVNDVNLRELMASGVQHWAVMMNGVDYRH